MTYAHIRQIQIHYIEPTQESFVREADYFSPRRQNNARSRTVDGIERHENNSVLFF